MYGGWFVPCHIILFSGRKGATRKPAKITFWRVFAWRPYACSPRKHVYTTWHKSATIVMCLLGLCWVGQTFIWWLVLLSWSGVTFYTSLLPCLWIKVTTIFNGNCYIKTFHNALMLFLYLEIIIKLLCFCLFHFITCI